MLSPPTWTKFNQTVCALRVLYLGTLKRDWTVEPIPFPKQPKRLPVVIGTESRTSSPIRIPRHADSLMHPDLVGLFPCGEGAGYAGGIVSAAMDGQRVARAVVRHLHGLPSTSAQRYHTASNTQAYIRRDNRI